ncbi:MAG: hypothetical protein LBK73_13075 [Treponema sp.]|nr:hypothetical protein [Treponema sp.]
MPEKFKQFGFDFGLISRNKKINDDERGIHAEIGAFLENSVQTMAIKVKAKLQMADVGNHIKRMKKLRGCVGLHGDRRELFGAPAATAVSGEDVKITKPDADHMVWQASEGRANGRNLWARRSWRARSAWLSLTAFPNLHKGVSGNSTGVSRGSGKKTSKDCRTAGSCF